MRIVRINGTRYAAGLWWRNTEDSSAGRAATLREARLTAARFAEAGFTCVAIRNRQYGLGRHTGRVPRLPSLADALAAGNSSHLGIYLLREGGPWWVCAVKDGRIAAEGDWLGDSPEAARKHALDMRDLLALDPLPGLGCDRAAPDSGRLALLLPPRRRLLLSSGGRLVPLRPSLHLPLAAAVSLTLLFLACSAGFFSDDGTHVRNTQEARRLEILAHPERYFPQPWMEQPSPEAWADRCLSALLRLPVNTRGWELTSGLCRRDTLEAAWTFSSGASFLRLPPDTELRDPTTAALQKRLPPIPPPVEPPALQTRQEIAQKLYEVANMFGLHLNLAWDPPLETTVSEGSLTVPVTAPWRRAQWTFTDVPAHLVLSRDFYTLLQSVPGLVAEQLTHRNGTWELKGISHGQ